ncbi:hypothetical protein LCGC14_0637690 [marine sediment metagenome]|uniref:Uncharacterized protein n=1 Tax=marine sediment metagenome TaxID=412755 RepID=A0A0F9U8K2_9ZZZZ
MLILRSILPTFHQSTTISTDSGTLTINAFIAAGAITMNAGVTLDSVESNSFGFRGYDTGVDLVQILETRGSVDPNLLLGRNDTGVTTNAVTDSLYYRAGAGSNNESAGFGFGISILLGNDASQVEERARLQYILTTATDGAEAAKMTWGLMSGGAAVVNRMELDDASTLSLLKASGQQINVKTITGQKTTNSGAGTETVTNAIPAGALVLGITIRNTTAVSGAGLGSYAIGDGTDADAWGTGIALGVDTTTTGADFTLSSPAHYAAAANLVFTGNAGQFDAGVIRYTIHYIDFTAAIS